MTASMFDHAHVVRIAEDWRAQLHSIVTAATRNRFDSRVHSNLPEDVIEMRHQFHGTRIVSHFYPSHWARVQLARHNVYAFGEGV